MELQIDGFTNALNSGHVPDTLLETLNQRWEHLSTANVSPEYRAKLERLGQTIGKHLPEESKQEGISVSGVEKFVPGSTLQSEKQKLLFENAAALLQEAVKDPKGFGEKLGLSGRLELRVSRFSRTGTPKERIGRLAKWLHEQGAKFDHKLLQRELN